MSALKMATPCRSIVRSSLQGLHYLSARRICLRKDLPQSVACLRSQQHGMSCRFLHSNRYPLLSSSQTETSTSTETVKNINDQKKTEEEKLEEETSEPEYIPKRKAKNPMMKIGYAWLFGLPTGVIGFILAKRQVDKNRLKQLKIRQRMKKSNEGEYERARYNPEAKTE